MFLSLDIETGGDAVGIVQRSAEIARADIVSTVKIKNKDTTDNIWREGSFSMPTSIQGLKWPSIGRLPPEIRMAYRPRRAYHQR